MAAQLRLELDSGATPSLEGIPALTPFIKWPGGKSLELPAIAAKAPPLTGRWRTSEAPKTYRWTIKSRNDRAATHLTIINY